jgi:tRNA(Ile)-lysidine synthase
MRDDSFVAALHAAWPPEQWRDVTVLVAVSGGADSVALLRGLCAVRDGRGAGRLLVTHFNHALRGRESDGDQAFVESLAEQLQLACMVGRAEQSLDASHSGQGLEGVARQARYAFLSQAAAHAGARFVATAHTADDQAETILHNVIRGTGLNGLAGMRRARPLSEATTLMHPLLEIRRADVEQYLKRIGQSFREDATNASLDLTRNRIRHTLLPLLTEQFNPGVRDALRRLAEVASEADDLLRELARSELSSLVTSFEDGVEINITPALATREPLMRYLLLQIWSDHGWPLRDMAFEKWREVAALACQPHLPTSQPTSLCLPGGVRAQRIKGVLHLTRPPTEVHNHKSNLWPTP